MCRGAWITLELTLLGPATPPFVRDVRQKPPQRATLQMSDPRAVIGEAALATPAAPTWCVSQQEAFQYSFLCFTGVSFRSSGVSAGGWIERRHAATTLNKTACSFGGGAAVVERT